MYKKIYILFVATLLFSLAPILSVYAEEEEEEGVTDVDDTEEFNIDVPEMGIYKSEDPFYQVETLDYSEVADIEAEIEEEESEDKGFIGSVGDGITDVVMFVPNLFSDTTEDVKNNIKDNMLYIMNGIVGMIMTIIQIEAELVLGIYNFANDAEIMNYLLNQIESVIQSVAGIDSSGSIMSDTGVFGNLLGIVIAISILFMTILFTIKRAQVEALKALLAPIISLTLAMILISNMSNILNTTNDITVSLMNNITQIGKENFFDEADTEIETTEDILHHTMVYKPYMLMQYGSYDDEVVSQERSKELLTTTNSSDRKTIIEEEMTEHGNSMVSPGAIWVKVAYGAFTLFCNLLISIPILIIAGLFLVIQFAIILIVFIAPFALIWAMLPNQLAVLKKYFSTLFAPFLFKLLISIFVMILTTILAIIFSMSSANGIVGYGVSMFIMAMVMVAMYLLKNRIMSIFTVTPEGRQLANAVNKGDGAVNATKKGTGMLIGAATGGVSTIATREVMNRVANRNNNSEEVKSSSQLSDLNKNRQGSNGLQDRNNVKSSVSDNAKGLSNLQSNSQKQDNNKRKDQNNKETKDAKNIAENNTKSDNVKNNQNQELHNLNDKENKNDSRSKNRTNESNDKERRSDNRELHNLNDKENRDKSLSNNRATESNDKERRDDNQELHNLNDKENKEESQKDADRVNTNEDKNRMSDNQELHDLKAVSHSNKEQRDNSRKDTGISPNVSKTEKLHDLSDRDKKSASSTMFNKNNISTDNNNIETTKSKLNDNQNASNINTDSRKSPVNEDNYRADTTNKNYEATKPDNQSKSEKMNDRDEKSSRGGIDE